jgi:hypothetical protein
LILRKPQFSSGAIPLLISGKKKEEKRKHFICLMITLDIGLYIILLVSCATGVESGTLVVSVVRQNQ